MLRVYEDDFGVRRIELHQEFVDAAHLGRCLWDIARRIAEQEDGRPLDEICRGFVHAIHLKQVAERLVCQVVSQEGTVITNIIRSGSETRGIA
jgi:hypothetical protein